MILNSLYSLLQLSHCAVIIYLTFILYEINKPLSFRLIGIEFVLTIIIQALSFKFNSRDLKQIFFSLTLIYALRPTQLNFLRFLFLSKLFYLQRSMSQISDNLSSSQSKFIKIIKIIFDYCKYTSVFYLGLGFLLVIYKYWAFLWSDPQKVIHTHQIFYFFMITASSVGYGDVTPKNDQQIYFLLTFIPIMIISFSIYCGKIIGCFEQIKTILRTQSKKIQETNKFIKQKFGEQTHKQLNFYISQSQKRYKQILIQNQKLAYNDMSIACENLSEFEPLIKKIIGQDASLQKKILLGTKLTKKFFPSNWTIINKGIIDDNIYMIKQGQIVIVQNNIILTEGSIFNHPNFYHKNPSNQTYRTKSFVSVWVLNTHDLQDLMRSSNSLNKTINNKILSQ